MEETKDWVHIENVDPLKYMVKNPFTKGMTKEDLIKKNTEFLDAYRGNDTLVDTVCFYGPDPKKVIEIDEKSYDEKKTKLRANLLS